MRNLENKTEYIAIDYFRLVFALLVVSIHIPMFGDWNENILFVNNEIVARIAVPYFFMVSGFFLKKKIEDRNKFFLYIKKIFRMYIVYSLLYIPEMLYGFLKTDDSLKVFVWKLAKDFVLCGTYMHLWYFHALIIATFMLYYCVETLKLRANMVILLACLLYIVGVLGGVYQSVVTQNEFVKLIFELYNDCFGATRNGIFFGFLFVALGYYIKVNNKTIDKKLLIPMLFVGSLFLSVEAYIVKIFIGIDRNLDMLFVLPFVVLCCFWGVCSIAVSPNNVQRGVYIRKISTLVFGFHLFVKFYLHWILLHVFKVTLNSLAYYWIMVIATFALAIVIIKLSSFKKFEWLKILYM